MSRLLSRINKARTTILADNEEPRDLVISVLREIDLRRELGQDFYHGAPLGVIQIMGMRVIWVDPRKSSVEMSIRTTKGDLRIVK